jgi:regulator of protease activity HflC (stomatin/prohibitin superfamily)
MSGMQKKLIIIGIIAVAVLIGGLILWPFKVIEGGHTGVRITLGSVSDDTLSEGIHFKTPVNRIQKLEVNAGSSSKDMQTVNSKIALNYRVDVKRSAELYKNVGLTYEANIIAPAMQESIKAITARYTAEELITKRQEVGDNIKNLLKEKITNNHGILVDNFNIIDFDFSKEFNAAIEAKQTAQQLALKAEQDLTRIKVEAQQKIAQAEAEAASLRAQKQEITPDLLKLRGIEAQLKAIEKWNGAMPQYITGDSGLMFNIPK